MNFSSQLHHVNSVQDVVALMDSIKVDPLISSGVSRVAPGRGFQPLPPLRLQRRPELIGFLLPQVTALCQQRRALRHPAASVDERLWILDPSILIAMEARDPAVIAVFQPTLSHGNAFNAYVLVKASGFC